MLNNNAFWRYCNKTLQYNKNKSSVMFDGFIAILIIISASITPLFFFNQFNNITSVLNIIECTITIIFLIEYILRLWSSDNRFLYIISLTGIVDILVVAPFILQHYNIIHLHFGILISIRMVRMIKLFFIYKNERDLTAKNIQNMQIHGDFEKGDNEIMLGIIHKHAIIFFISLFPVLIFTTAAVFILAIFKVQLFAILGAIILLLIASLIFAKNWLDFHYDAIYITDKRLVIQNSHIFGSDQQTIPLAAIKEIHPKTYGIINYCLDSGSLEIDTGATENTIAFRNVSNIKKMKKVLLNAHIKQAHVPS